MNSKNDNAKIKALSNISNLTANFEEIGFKKNHAVVYLALLKSGKLKIFDIVKKTGIQRSYVYDILCELTEKGLVSCIAKNNTKEYYADDPHKLLEIIKTKEKNISKFKTEYEGLLPYFDLANTSTADSILTYEGRNGIKNIFEDILKEKKNYVCFYSGESEFLKNFGEYANTFQKKANSKKLKSRMIYSDIFKGKKPIPSQKGFVKVRFLPKQFSSPIAILVYGNKTAIILWKSMIGILIDSKETAKCFSDYFEVLWKTGSK